MKKILFIIALCISSYAQTIKQVTPTAGADTFDIVKGAAWNVSETTVYVVTLPKNTLGVCVQIFSNAGSSNPVTATLQAVGTTDKNLITPFTSQSTVFDDRWNTVQYISSGGYVNSSVAISLNASADSFVNYLAGGNTKIAFVINNVTGSGTYNITARMNDGSCMSITNLIPSVMRGQFQTEQDITNALRYPVLIGGMWHNSGANTPRQKEWSLSLTGESLPNRSGIQCLVAVSTATTIQAVGGNCVAPGAGLSIYVTDVMFGTSAAAGTAADSFPTLKSGTGGTCGAATTVVWQALTTANSTVVANFTTPLKITANNELCWIMTTAGSKTVEIRGFIAP